MKTALPARNERTARATKAAVLPDERQQECTAHLDACSGCQAQLEALATGGTDVSRLVQNLHEANPAPRRPIGRLEVPGGLEAEVRRQRVAPCRGREMFSLHFLQPASDSGYLGRLATST